MAQKTQLYKIIKDKNAELIVDQLEQATSFFERGKGLLGREGMADSHGLWIKPCNNIHTFFMKFRIDCIFLDEHLVIQRIASNMKPFRVAGPVWKARSVIELKAGTAEKWKLSVGDQLYVVS
jgi:uncharacterized protein